MLPEIKAKLKRTLDSQVDLTKDLFDERNHFSNARNKMIDALPFWVAGGLTAIASILYAKIFLATENFALLMADKIGYWILLTTPTLFLASWYFVERFAPYANGSGIPQLMMAIERLEKKPLSRAVTLLLGFRIIVVKVISSLLGVLGGGAIGREGPTLQIAGSIFDLTHRFWPGGAKSISRHGMVLAGGAAGLAAAFNTPLGGIAYVIEELSKSHLSFFRTGILYAVIVAGLISQLLMGSYLYFGYPKLDTFQFSTLGPVILFALFAGLVGTLFGQFLKYVFNFRGTLKSKSGRVIMALACGLVFSALALFVSKATFGSGKEALNLLLFTDQSFSYPDLLSRFFGTATTYAAGGAGGIFAPTLALGGMAANLLSAHFFADAGALAILVGMTSALAALTQSPLTSFILILEMTDRHSAILPIMMAALIGQGVSKLFSHHSFYEYVSKRMIQTLPQE